MTKLTISDWDGEEITIYEDHNRPRMRKDQTPAGQQQLSPEEVERQNRRAANTRHLQDLYAEARKANLRHWPAMNIPRGIPRRCHIDSATGLGTRR